MNPVSGAAQPIIIVQGAQWGSEGKGMVVAAMCLERNVDICVRTGAVNAGHTVYHDGYEFKMQQIPCGFVRADTILVIGAGAYIHPEILAGEISLISSRLGEDIRKRLFIDHRAGLHLPTHTDRAKMADRHHKVGATGKGCSEAIVSKIRGRGTDEGKLFRQWLDEGHSNVAYPEFDGLQFVDTEAMLNTAYDDGKLIMLEGTQGTLLDLHLGPYPYTTNKQTTAAQWVTECGLSPSLMYEVVLVARTYPIRVAGNSGPMPREISWVDLAARMNRRLRSFGQRERVAPEALSEFARVSQMVAADAKFDLPKSVTGNPRYDFHNFTADERVRYQVAISEFHQTVLNSLPLAVAKELRNLFEVTTVTKKLRRIAELDLDMLKVAVRQNRPDYIVLTFLNHQFPELWGSTLRGVAATDEVKKYLEYIENEIDLDIDYITTGPYSSNFFRTR